MRTTAPFRAAIALGAVLVLASCSAGGAPPPSESSTAVADRTATVVYGGQITPSHLDPHRGVTENDIPMLRYWYDTLTTVVGNGGEPAPFLAESWELSDDGKTFTMKLREGVTFVDGEPLDAAAVVANFDRMINDPNSTVAYVLAPIIESSEVVDPLTVKLNLKGGVRVASAEGAAARAGLREGDVIVAIANTETASVKDVEAALAKVEKARPINVLFRRGEWAQYAVIRAPPTSHDAPSA